MPAITSIPLLTNNSLVHSALIYLLIAVGCCGCDRLGGEVGVIGGVAAFALKMSIAGGETRKLTLDPVETLSLGGGSLRQIVTDAARHDLEETDGDLRGIAWLEHLNLVVGSRTQAEQFYIDFLGFTPDASRSFHVNLGRQQFHLAEVDGEPAQRIMGSVGLAVPNLDNVRDRVETATEVLGETEFRILNDDKDDARQCLTVSCPWGNVFHLYDVRDDDKATGATPPSSRKMVNLHREGGAHGPNRMAVMGGPGIRCLEVRCRGGTSRAIAKFYEEMLGCTVSTHGIDDDDDASAVAVCVGPGVHFVFVEEDEGEGSTSSTLRPITESDEEAMRGVHACVYAHDFRNLYERLSSRNLVWTNPRFTHLDSCDTWEEAWESRTLRFRYLVDLEDHEGFGGGDGAGRRVLELEHETRPLRHGQYMKVPRYEPR